MSSKITASEFGSAYEAYKTAKVRQSMVEEIVHIQCSQDEYDEIVGADDEDREGEVDCGDVYEIWGTSHTQSGSYEWRVHLDVA